MQFSPVLTVVVGPSEIKNSASLTNCATLLPQSFINDSDSH